MALLPLISCFSRAANATEHETLIGKAFDKNHHLFYIETNHLELKDTKLSKIDSFYKDKNDKLIVEIHANFDVDPYIPETDIIDHRKGTEIKLKFLKDQKKIFISRKLKGEWITKQLGQRENMLNALGLINYIRENSSQLKAQGKKTFRYIVAALNDDFGMELEYIAGPDSKLLTFGFRLQNFFIRQLSGVSESFITFNSSTKSMKSFKGVSNITDSTNKAVEVTIAYDDPIER
jgi:hypothetical protein